MDPGNEDPSSTAQGIGADEEKEKIQIIVEAIPQSWSISFRVKPSCTIWRLIHDMESRYRNSRDAYEHKHIIKFLESFEETGMLLFKGKDLMEHPFRTLQQWGVKNRDKLIIRDKRPFSVGISMQEKRDYGITKEWRDFEASCHKQKHQIWLYAHTVPELEPERFSPMDAVRYSPCFSSGMEVNIRFCVSGEFLHIAVESYYTVNQLTRMIREVQSSEEICMLVFQWKNLLEHGSSTLGDLGINDQDTLLIPFKGPFTILISISPSSFGQQQGTKRPDLHLYVEPVWTVLTLKEKINTKINIPVNKLTLCCVREGFDNEKCHLVMHDSMTLATYGIMEGGHCIGLYFEDDQPTKENGGGPL